MLNLADAPRAPARFARRYLTPGDLLVVAEPCEITTILGPCVAVTFWCRHSRVAAICHAMLPEDRGGGAAALGARPWKYVTEVIPEMLARFLQRGGRLSALEIKLFGGAELLGVGNPSSNRRIGPQNEQFARRLLAENGLAVIASDVGGQSGRKLIFNTLTGDVRIKRLASPRRAAA